ncbi:MAG: hypothetical protein EOP86_12455 [Verrucomicrobiaceae bacterium]|nr:MAG: hypothetical protein EOP86_12455 [Verrucomicrobiaceae bacterium]
MPRRSPTSLHAPSKDLPRRTITLRATGDMERYIWSFNGRTFAEDGVIPIKKGEVIRLEFINDTMMHHPLHLHGHFFRILAGQGKLSPLKHTIDLPPMGRRTVEFEANDRGDWLFHCHLLYHMHAGMTRIFSYQDSSWQPPLSDGAAGGGGGGSGHSAKPGRQGMPDMPASSGDSGHQGGLSHTPDGGGHEHDPLYLLLDGTLQSHMSEGRLTARNSHNDWYADWEAGYPDDDTEYEIDLSWRRYFNPNFSTILGWRMTNGEDSEDRPFAGVEYRLPYLINSSLAVDGEGDVRAGLNKRLQLTDRVNLLAEVQYDTGSQWEWSAGAEHLLNKTFSLITQYHSDYGFGGGLRFRF